MEWLDLIVRTGSGESAGQWAGAIAAACIVIFAVWRNFAVARRTSDASKADVLKLAEALIPAIEAELEEWQGAMWEFSKTMRKDDLVVVSAAIALDDSGRTAVLHAPLPTVGRFRDRIANLRSPVGLSVISAHSRCVALGSVLAGYKTDRPQSQAVKPEDVGRLARAASSAVREALEAIRSA